MKTLKNLIALFALLIGSVSCDSQIIPSVGQYVCPRASTTNTDGMYMVAYASSGNALRYSSDYGVTWVGKIPTTGSNRVFINGDGSLIAVTPSSVSGSTDGIYKSVNGGTSWTFKAVNTTTNDHYYLNGSYDGKYLALTTVRSYSPYTGYLYTSSDYGDTWTLNSLGYLWWNRIHCSATGQYMTTSINGTSKILLSSNYGSTFNYCSSMNSRNWQETAISGNGQYMFAQTYNSTILAVSSDYGSTWTEKTAPITLLNGVGDISYDGKYQYWISFTSPYYLLRSSDYGATWASITTNLGSIPRDLKCSGSGKYVLVGTSVATFLSSNYGDSFSNVIAVSGYGVSIGKQQ